MSGKDDPALTVYGAPWCPHCKRVKKFLAAHPARSGLSASPVLQERVRS